MVLHGISLQVFQVISSLQNTEYTCLFSLCVAKSRQEIQVVGYLKKKKNRSNFVGLKIQVNVRKNIFTDLWVEMESSCSEKLNILILTIWSKAPEELLMDFMVKCSCLCSDVWLRTRPHTHRVGALRLWEQTWRHLLFNYVYSTEPHLSPTMAPNTH